MRGQYFADESALVVEGERHEWVVFRAVLAGDLPLHVPLELSGDLRGLPVNELIVAGARPELQASQGWLAPDSVLALRSSLEDILEVNDVGDFALPGWHAHCSVSGLVVGEGEPLPIVEFTIAGPDRG